MVITSSDNEKIKYYRKLQEKKYRKLYSNFLIEGEHLILEAFKKNLIEELILVDDYPLDVKKVFVSKGLMKKISTLENPPNIMAMCKINEDKLEGNRFLILDNIQDPGNLGSIIRSAAAFNIDTIVLSSDTVDMYNPKVIRATQGMFLNVNIIVSDIIEIISLLKRLDIKIYGTSLEGGKNLKKIDLNRDKFALILGNEGEGVQKEILEKCDELIYINLSEKVESLNVSVAGAIILYELSN